jgi:RNA polymerase sigma factor (sigma-70 family)
MTPETTAADPAALFRGFGGSLYGTALRFLRRPEEAEDVVQDAFLVYHRSVARDGLALREPDAVAWVRRVVVNRCLDRLRHGKRWRLTEIDGGSGAEGAAGGDGERGSNPDALLVEAGLTATPRPAERVDLARAVAKLPEEQRQVFLLYAVEGFLHREISELLGIAEGTSKAYLSRAKEALRATLSSVGDRASGERGPEPR